MRYLAVRLKGSLDVPGQRGQNSAAKYGDTPPLIRRECGLDVWAIDAVGSRASWNVRAAGPNIAPSIPRDEMFTDAAAAAE